FEVPVLSLLCRLVVVRRGSKNGVNSGPRSNFFGFFHGLVRRVRGSSRHDRHAPSRYLDGRVNYMKPFIVRESRCLAGSAAGNQKIYSGLHLPCHQIPQSSVINRTILMKRSYKCRTAATELHANKITLMGGHGNGWRNYNSRQTALKS